MKFNLQKETEELRRRSPLSATPSGSIVLLVIFGIICMAIAYGLYEPRNSNSAFWAPIAIGCVLFVGSVLLTCHRFARAKRLVTEGVVVAATPVSVKEFMNGQYIVEIDYQVGGDSCEKTLYIPVNGLGIANAGFMLLAVLPSKPRVVEPIYSFATNKESMDLVPGFRGLAMENTPSQAEMDSRRIG